MSLICELLRNSSDSLDVHVWFPLPSSTSGRLLSQLIPDGMLYVPRVIALSRFVEYLSVSGFLREKI